MSNPDPQAEEPPNTPTMAKPSLPTVEDLAKIVAASTLHNDPREKRMDRSTRLLKAYLIKNEPEFVRVTEFRDRGWIQNKEKGDAFFKLQREKADNADEIGEKRFYSMMLQLADEMQSKTGAFFPQKSFSFGGPLLPRGGLSPLGSRENEFKSLDICMAPGGYTAAVLKYHPNAKAYGITLPIEQGGHPLHIPKNRLAGLKLLDITMLAAEFTDRPLPANHPGRAEFLSVRPFRHYAFDLVFCDGMVLRTQERPTYREENEVTRLSCSQMILAMQRVAEGGTIIMLLHKIDSWGAASILYTFSKFAKVEVFKPTKKHATRSSFYLIAKEVRSGSEDAKKAVQEWKDAWWKATFGGEGGTGEPKQDPPESVVMGVMEDFGERLMEMGRPVWRIQADALSRTEYAGDGSASSPFGKDIIDSPSPRRLAVGKGLQENVVPLRETSSLERGSSDSF
ncbi:hypothetical protein G7Y89_g4541 [Cudoniella acicularis]|uniref:Ribosomal RNA methyltransferase FtsJ domain-containing protein n=1 Tax=Cudoniella acicularis TaxID=354080 RepID=A0A8H4RR91_9HELO|nr:hypothetical protein G7Y89_g4541 [Cudoniella acicularis]